MTDAIQKADTLEFTTEQRKMIRDSFLNGASEPEAAMLMELARVRKLNPITRQIHFVKRWDSNKRCEVWSAQVGIDGFRSIAERTGRYDGQDEPEFEYDDKGAMKLCRVKVYRKDWSRPSVGLAHFTEYAQYTKDKTTQAKSLNSMWATKPHIMLAKCAEALAFRKAFPEDMSGLYSSEEMGGNGEPPEPPPEPPKPGKTQTAVVKEIIEAKKASQQTVDAVPQLPPITAPTNVSAKTVTAKKQYIQDESTPTPVERIKALGEKYAVTGMALTSLVNEALGRRWSKADLTDENVARVEKALQNFPGSYDANTGEVAGPPPHTDEDAIPF